MQRLGGRKYVFHKGFLLKPQGGGPIQNGMLWRILQSLFQLLVKVAHFPPPQTPGRTSELLFFKHIILNFSMLCDAKKIQQVAVVRGRS